MEGHLKEEVPFCFHKRITLNELTIPDAAYIAGIIDGEGSIVVTRVRRPANRSGYRFYPVVSIINTDLEMLEFVQKTTGLGKVYKHSQPKNLKAKRVAYKWQLKQQIAGNFLRAILPFLRIKKASAQNCIEFCEEVKNRGNYGNYDLEKMEYFWKKSSEINTSRGTLLDEDIKPESSQGRSMAEMRKYDKGPQSMTFQEAMIKFAQINGHYPRD